MKGAFKNEEHIKTSMHGISRVGNSNHYPAGDNAHAAEKQYWTESDERVGIVEQVMNDGSNQGNILTRAIMKVGGENCLFVSTLTQLSKMAIRHKQTQVRV